MTAKPDRTLVEALVALATREGLGDPIDWLDVRAATTALLDDPIGPRDLRAVMERLNDKAVAITLSDWFIRAAAEREADAKAATRGAEKLLQPLLAISLGIGGTGAVAIASGSIALPVAVPIALCGLAVGIAATIGRWRLTKRADEALDEAQAIRRLAEIATSPTP